MCPIVDLMLTLILSSFVSGFYFCSIILHSPHHAGRQQMCCYSPVSAFTWFKSTDTLQNGGFSSRTIFFIDHPTSSEIELRRKMSLHKWRNFKTQIMYLHRWHRMQQKKTIWKSNCCTKNHYCYAQFLFVLLNVD